MHPTSELILRNAASFSSGTILLFNAPRDGLGAEVGHSPTNPDFPVTDASMTGSPGFQTFAAQSLEGRMKVGSVVQPVELPGSVVQPAEPTSFVIPAGREASGDPANTSAGEPKGTVVTAFSQDFGDAQWLQQSGIACEFGLLPEAQSLPVTVILFLPREKDRLEFLLHFLASNMPANGQLWLVGENKAGIKSAESRLQQRFSKVKKVDSARHCVLYQVENPAAGTAFRVDDYLQDWAIETNAGEIKLQSLPGSFAHGRLDKGTALLLNYLQNADKRQLKIKGKILDFGCGAGVIGLYLKHRNPDIALEMLDTAASALESTRRSLLLNDFEAQVTASDGLDGTRTRFDWIISNPPFHKGVATDLDIARRFISAAPAKLGNRGRMLLVCNRHLPYEAWLAESFIGFEKVADSREFKILLAHGPKLASYRRR